MMKDVDAHKGLLITPNGYSQAAINRAHYDLDKLELDVLNFKELKDFQAFCGIPYSGNHGVIMPSPFGWIIDISQKQKGMLATLFQRGFTFEEAVKNNEWMYVGISSKDAKFNDLNSVLELQKEATLLNFPDAVISYHHTIKRKNTNTIIRTIEIKSYPSIEYTGFIEFNDFIFICVLFTPIELKEKNLKKLEYILSKVVPLNVEVKNNSLIYNKVMLDG